MNSCQKSDIMGLMSNTTKLVFAAWAVMVVVLVFGALTGRAIIFEPQPADDVYPVDYTHPRV